MTKELQNLVWSILPKEFKEEVKKMRYNKDFTNEQKIMIRLLFGDDNLTSDAEGEDEMLFVSRKRVQEEYAILSKELSRRDTDAEDYIAWNYAKMTFEELFGSKCLPDDVATSAPNVDSLEPKFKLGDKVRVKGCGYEPNLHKGDIGEILDTNDKEQCFVLFKKSQAWIYADCLEPYTEPKYHKGEKVCYNGYVYEIEGLVGRNRYALKGLNFDLDEDMIDSYTEPEESANISQNITNCDKQFDNILKDSFSKERRLSIAVQIMSGILSNQRMLNNLASGETTAEGAVKCIVDTTMMYTDALMTKCDKGGNNGED